MVTSEQKEQYIAELKTVVEKYPKSFVGYINSRGFKGRTPNRQYLRDFIKEQTPFDDHVVEVLSNRSHFTENAEKVILLK